MLPFTDKKANVEKLCVILISLIGACMKGEAAEKETPLSQHIMFVPPVIKLGSQ